MKKSKEKWYPIKDFEGYFEVSDKGRIRSLPRVYKTGKHMIPRKKDFLIKKHSLARGYPYTNLEVVIKGKRIRINKSVHRAVAENIIPNPLNLPQVNHKDGDKTNNHVENLEWCTVSHNILHSYRVLGRKKPRGKIKFSEESVNRVRELRIKGWMHKDIAKEVGMGVSTVTHILLGSRRSIVRIGY